MKPRTSCNPQSHRISLTQHELDLIRGALAETLEEKNQPYSRADLARLVRLHRRFDLLSTGTPDYAFVNGAVVSASNHANVIVHSVRPGVRRDRTGTAVDHA